MKFGKIYLILDILQLLFFNFLSILIKAYMYTLLIPPSSLNILLDYALLKTRIIIPIALVIFRQKRPLSFQLKT